MVEYPKDFPVDAFQEVLAFVEKKDTDQRKFAQALYTLLGYGLFTFVGNPKLGINPTASMPSWLIPILEQLAQQLITHFLVK